MSTRQVFDPPPDRQEPSEEDASAVGVLIEVDYTDDEGENGIDLSAGDLDARIARDLLLAKLDDLGIDSDELRDFCQEATPYNALPSTAAEQSRAIRREFSELIDSMHTRGAKLYNIKLNLLSLASAVASMEDAERRRRNGKPARPKAAEEDQQQTTDRSSDGEKQQA